MVSGLDYGLSEDDLKIWYGIITLIVVELGLITPPVGLNVFIINSLSPDVPMRETFKGVMPFFCIGDDPHHPAGRVSRHHPDAAAAARVTLAA